jgi:hypothetical protein
MVQLDPRHFGPVQFAPQIAKLLLFTAWPISICLQFCLLSKMEGTGPVQPYESNRGGKKISYLGFSYNLKRANRSGTSYWRCENRQCGGSLVTSLLTMTPKIIVFWIFPNKKYVFFSTFLNFFSEGIPCYLGSFFGSFFTWKSR